MRPEASEGEAQHGPFCWNGCFGQGPSICIVDDAGKIVREVKVASEPEALRPVLRNSAYHFKRIGLEAGPLSHWLFSVLAEQGPRDLCRDAAHASGVEGADQQDGPQRCARYSENDASGA